jgi:hypothetical protein
VDEQLLACLGEVHAVLAQADEGAEQLWLLLGKIDHARVHVLCELREVVGHEHELVDAQVLEPDGAVAACGAVEQPVDIEHLGVRLADRIAVDRAAQRDEVLEGRQRG